MEAWHTRRRITPTGAWLFRHLRNDGRLRLPRTLAAASADSSQRTRLLGFSACHVVSAVLAAHEGVRAIDQFGRPHYASTCAGREAQGVIEPEDFARVCDDIADLSMDLRIPETGGRAVSEVIRVRDRFDASPAPLAHDADLAIVWNPGIRQCLVSPRFGQLGPLPILSRRRPYCRRFLLRRRTRYCARHATR